jgi:hypothetical protein
MSDAIEMTLVRDAVAANVDLMPGPFRIVERAIASAGELERRRRRARKVGAGLTVATLAAGAFAIAVASGWRPPA